MEMRTKEKMKHFLGLKYLTTPLASLSTGDKSVSPNVWLFVMETLLEVTLDFFIWKSIKFLNICSLYFKSRYVHSGVVSFSQLTTFFIEVRIMNELWMVILTSLQLVMTLARLEWRSVGVPVLHATELQKPRAACGRKIGIYTHI